MNTRIYVVGIIVLIVPVLYAGIGLWQAIHGLLGH
jgi:hypothetical protein